jgi:hypothetical protein
MDGGRVFQAWVDELKQFIEAHKADAAFSREVGLLNEALETILELSDLYKKYSKEGKLDLVALTSTRFLDCMAEVAIAHLLLEQALIACAKLADGTCIEADTCFYQGKVQTVRYYILNFLPQVFGRARVIKMEDSSAMNIQEEWF